MKEIWKDVVGYEGHYQVSNMGNVVSVKFNQRRLINQYNHNQGYKMVRIYLNGKGRTIKVHRLVALAFIDENLPNNHSLVVDHINDNKADNRLDNLQILTTRQNNIKQGRYSKGTSKYVGVYWASRLNKFLSYIHIGKKKILVGSFDCEEQANEKRNKKLIEYGIKV
jgi:hypothetical protein